MDDYCREPSRTLIYVTHYQEELPKCIDKQLLLVLHEGSGTYAG